MKQSRIMPCAPSIETDQVFVTEWNDNQFLAMKGRLAQHFAGLSLITRSGKHGLAFSFNQLDNFLGLAYTSSGDFACYSICNEELIFDEKFNYERFAIGMDGKFYAILWDANENEKIIQI